MEAEIAAKKQRGRPWPKGVSGNPAGKPKGARSKTTLAAEVLLEGQAAALCQKAINLALDGDVTALRLCLERIAPPRKSRCIQLELPSIQAVADVNAAQALVIQSMARGEISPDEAATIANVIETRRKA